ncbi:MAG: phosphotransferase [Candidatus Cloacimonetes bacterium]|nr:phosphotransferase [Candidatus Cloacimonadota bacterium]
MVPTLLAAEKPNWLRINKINGVPYLNELFDPTLLAKTIADFHISTLEEQKCLCHIDNQPANILMDSNRYYLIDFEDSRIDFPERDVSHLLLFWAADIATQRFIGILADFLKTYTELVPLSRSRWRECLQASISTFDKRRLLHNKPFGQNPLDNHLANRALLSAGKMPAFPV